MAPAPPVPAIVAASRRRVASYFLSRNAVRSNDAVRFETKRPLDRRMFDKLLETGIIRAGGNDTYFLDVVEYDGANQRRRKRVMGAVGAAMGLAVVFGLLR